MKNKALAKIIIIVAIAIIIVVTMVFCMARF